MNPREKLLATCMAAVLILGGLAAVVRWGVVQRWQTLGENIRETQRDQIRLSGRLEEARTAEQDWCELKPLSRGAHGAEQRFRGDIGQLLKDHGLDDKCTVSTRAARKLKSGFPEVRLSIQLQEATLRQVLGFLSDFYRRDYLAKLDQVTLMVAEQGGRDRGERSRRDRKGGRRRSAAARRNPDDPKLNVNMTATALVLPVIKAIDADKQRPIKEVVPREGSWGRGRPLSEYDPILASNLFREKLPEPVTVVRAEGGDQPKPVTPTRSEEPRVEPTPSKKIVGVTSDSGKLVARIRDMDRLDLPVEKVGLNDPVHDGTLVLVLQEGRPHDGIVVQVPGEDAGTYKYYFYELGTMFSERVELDHEQYPEILEQLEWALGR